MTLIGRFLVTSTSSNSIRPPMLLIHGLSERELYVSNHPVQVNLINKRLAKVRETAQTVILQSPMTVQCAFQDGSSLDVDCQGCGSATITLGCIRCGAMHFCCSEVGLMRATSLQRKGIDSGLNPDFHNQKAAGMDLFPETELQSAHLITVRLTPLVLISCAACFDPSDPKIL
ncbi:hypothetical protein GB937_000909 [Aspergillus fischeri]|nr:hypothetical protein GB937_000909 [Aspergillus fischeri]